MIKKEIKASLLCGRAAPNEKKNITVFVINIGFCGKSLHYFFTELRNILDQLQNA